MSDSVKFQLMSDLHMEGNMPLRVVNDHECDVLVLAGDICTPKSFPTLTKFFDNVTSEYDVVIYVLGNHELYRWETPNDKSHYEFFRVMLKHHKNLVILENETMNYKGLRIAGATLWTDFDDGYLVPVAAKVMNDYKWGLKVSTVYDWFQESYTFLKNCKADVVVTHHAPLEASVHKRFYGDMYNGLFHARLDDLVTELRPHLWMHGHMHNCADYMHGATRVVCNPLGYGRENPSFDYRKVLSVPTLHNNSGRVSREVLGQTQVPSA